MVVCGCLLVLVWPGIGSNQDMLILATTTGVGGRVLPILVLVHLTGVHWCHTVQTSTSYIIPTNIIKYNGELCHLTSQHSI